MFNNAAQVWNHTFYWNCLSPKGGGEPGGKLADAIKKAFGGFSPVQGRIHQDCGRHVRLGLGLAGAARRTARLGLVSTINAATPITGSDRPLLTCDVWEHAYYIDYRNARPKYSRRSGIWSNWDFIASQMA